MRRTKIVATIGPACETRESLQQLLEAGLNVARLNFSHGSHAWHEERIALLRDLEAERGVPLAILQDLSGPKLRVGTIPGDGLRLEDGGVCFLTPAAVAPASEAIQIPVPIPPLLAALKPGCRLFLDDGWIELAVVDHEGETFQCEIVSGGVLTSRKGITAPGVALDIPSLTDRDRDDLRFGIAQKVDWIAVSYVRRADDLAAVRAIMAENGVSIPIVAKIEKWEAVQNLEALAEAADALMVARGDLGVELPLHEVPSIQKAIIRAGNRVGKPVITATQMLDSMIRNPRPTRAEVSDVANAILDGTDAVMLSGETAMGEHPVEAVRVMDQIARRTEESLDFQRVLAERQEAGAGITGAISHAACQIAADLGAAAIIASTTSGQTARMISRHRPSMPVVGATASSATFRRLALSWGVHPLLCSPTHNTDEMLAEAVSRVEAAGLVEPGDTVVISAGVPVGVPGSTNLIKVRRV